MAKIRETAVPISPLLNGPYYITLQAAFHLLCRILLPDFHFTSISHYKSRQSIAMQCFAGFVGLLPLGKFKYMGVYLR